ncbi:hypothetical protein MUB24_21695 [Lederbergia sp. NSJ-179]|uniref:hypothetical protein n=1 Tax=Lederbergia sp. NSJ-179 TaxID=2931402 RepID=UPI001FD34155|nr:hypothetical protein [Lederbergia sp. NSJ-179]MCJ7843440.1 hypothetical protein [Lederbergia sp. NSJ-179]
MFEIYDVLVIPLIIGLVEAFKIAGVSKRFLPLIAIGVGIVIGIVYMTELNLKQGILVGIILGLSASGLYSGTKNTIERKGK